MKSKSELNMEIEQLEKQLKEAQKKADYYEAHYNVNYETWLRQTTQVIKVNKFLNEIPAFALENEDMQLWFEKMKVALQELTVVSNKGEM